MTDSVPNPLLDEMAEMNAQLEKAIQHSNEMAVEGAVASSELRQIFNASSDGIWVVDLDFNVTRINIVLQQMTGLEEDEAVGRKCFELFDCGICNTEDCTLRQVKKGRQRVEKDIEWQSEDGEKEYYICTGTPYTDLYGDISGVVENFKNITIRKHAEQALNLANDELQRQANRDSLTQIPNRRMFSETIAKEWARLIRDDKPLSVIMCDIDFFKLFNDGYGHQAGDVCLQKVAKAIEGAVKRPADLVARYGGEEFIALLPDTDIDGAIAVAEHIRQAVCDLEIAHETSKIHDHVTVSVGVASVQPCEALSYEYLIKEADDRLYYAKEQGRNRVVSALASPVG
jgi:diguanylate cyclase (GGDEF)-like protein/PAS domain S-box-containing protein